MGQLTEVQQPLLSQTAASIFEGKKETISKGNKRKRYFLEIILVYLHFKNKQKLCQFPRNHDSKISFTTGAAAEAPSPPASTKTVATI